jgi:hypothetical protein
MLMSRFVVDAILCDALAVSLDEQRALLTVGEEDQLTVRTLMRFWLNAAVNTISSVIRASLIRQIFIDK